MHKNRWLVLAGVVAALLSLAFFVAACGKEEEAGAPTATEGTMVAVTVQEWSVNPETTSVPAGSVTFEVENIGPEHEHKFTILKTDLDAASLPTLDDGSVDEADSGVEFIDEIDEEDLPVGGSQELPVDLEAGAYVLICNIVKEEDGETESHYQQGMRTDFDVTE